MKVPKTSSSRLWPPPLFFVVVNYLSLFDCVLDINVGLGVGNGVPNTDTVPLQQQPVVDQGLDVTVHFAGDHPAILHKHHVGQGAAGGTQGLLTQDTTDQQTIFNQYLTKSSKCNFIKLNPFFYHTLCRSWIHVCILHGMCYVIANVFSDKIVSLKIHINMTDI